MAESGILWPTPKGAYHFASEQLPSPQRWLIANLLLTGPVPFRSEVVTSLLGEVEAGEALLQQLLSASWLQLLETPPDLPQGSYEELLEELIAPLGDRGVLLFEEEGFYLASKGFPHEVAEHLAALGADLLRLAEHHRDLLGPMLKVWTAAWSLVDAAGLSRIGFWPLYLEGRRFGLVIEGVPMLNHPNLVLLIWQLLRHYHREKA